MLQLLTSVSMVSASSFNYNRTYTFKVCIW